MKYITFAVPCYNSENYMRRCIDSLLAGGRDVEIILINDGSTDRTAQIADEYQLAHDHHGLLKPTGRHAGEVRGKQDHMAAVVNTLHQLVQHGGLFIVVAQPPGGDRLGAIRREIAEPPPAFPDFNALLQQEQPKPAYTQGFTMPTLQIPPAQSAPTTSTVPKKDIQIPDFLKNRK